MSLICEKIGSVFWIRINRPHRKNAIDIKTYIVLTDKLREADADNEVVYTVLTGEGNIYSSGSDFTPKSVSDINLSINENFDISSNFVDALIDHSKILIALVNGPAVGIACTTLSLFDYVIASDKAFFVCPFTELGVVPEGTSSVNFPAIFGYSRAAEILLFGAKLDVNEAHRLGFVNRIVTSLTPNEFRCKAKEILNDYIRRLPPHSLLASKAMLKPLRTKQKLKEVNLYEFSRLKDIWKSDETQQRLIRRFARSKI